MKRRVRSAPNYTNACLVMGAANLFWIFILIKAIWGMLAVLGLAFCLNRGISRLRT